MIRVLIADDHGIVRSGLSMLIERQADMQVTAEAQDGVEAVERTLAEHPDVAVLDVSMPRMTGLHAARQIRAHADDVHVLMLSMHEDDGYFFDALEAGPRAMCPSARPTAASSRRSGPWPRRHVPQLAHAAGADEAVAGRTVAPGPSDELTPRELEVVKLIAEAYTNRQIAEVLQLSEKTVESHRANVLAKLGMRDRVELVRYAIRRGLVEP